VRILRLSINALALCFLLLGGWKLFDRFGTYDQGLLLIADIEKKALELEIEAKKHNEEHTGRFSIERNRNQQLEEDQFEFSREESKQRQTLEEEQKTVQEMEDSLASLSNSIEDAKINLNNGEKEIIALREESNELMRSLPIMEGSMTDVRTAILEQEGLAQNLDEQLANYESTTKMLQEHYERNVEAFVRDKRERPWFHKGKSITVRNASLDLESGLLALPVGKDHGVEMDRVLSVQILNREICKIKITQANLRNSIAHIIPLVGEPERLLNLSEFDLYHL